MGKIFYIITTRLYFLLIRMAAPFNAKAKKMIEGRKNQWKIIQTKMKSVKGKVIWLHCASLGEFEQGRPVIEKLKDLESDVRIVITFYSPSGYEVRKNFSLADAVFYLPFDSRSNARKFIEAINPQLAIFVKYEFWYFYLSALNQNKIPTISVSAIFRAGQLFFKSYGGFYRRMLDKFDHIFVQNEISERLIKGAGLTQVTLAGDTRFDRVFEICRQAEDIPAIEKFKNKKKIIMVGSSWPNDIDLLIPFFNKSIEKYKFVIAPHEISEKNIVQIENSFKGPSLRYSHIDDNSVKEADLLIIDNVGMLSSLYKYAEYAYVGGSFNHGLHNTLEAATYGIPVFFGKSSTNAKYNEAIDLMNKGAGFEVKDTDELTNYMEKLESNQELYLGAARSAKDYIQQNLGATNKIVSYIEEKISGDA